MRVASLENVNDWSKAGVMIRESLAANSRNAFMMVTPEGARALPAPQQHGRFDDPDRQVLTGTAPVWLRLVRQGNTFTGYQSANGTSWTSTGSATISMTSSVYVGHGGRQPRRFDVGHRDVHECPDSEWHVHDGASGTVGQS